MCVIIVSPKGQLPLSDVQLETLIRLNPDGAGVLSFCNGELQMRKTRDATPAWVREQFLAAQQNIVVLHLRQATRGAVSDANIQPFWVLEDSDYQFALAHNGTLDWYQGDDTCSDSRYFAHHVARSWRLCHGQNWTCQKALQHLSSFLPDNNRMVLVDNTGQLAILGESEGFWLDTVWVSNPKVRTILSERSLEKGA